MEFKSNRKPIIDYLLIIMGTTLLAIGINVFLEPLNMVTGGVVGIAIIIKDLTSPLIEGGVPLWLTNLVINIPLFLGAVLVKGRNFGKRSLFATLYLSLALFYTQWLPPLTLDVFLGSIFGAVLAGIGLGLVFAAFATTGGSDLAASIVQHFMRHHSVAQIMLVIDAAIIAAGILSFGIEISLYAIISVFISSKVVDAILEGLSFSKAAFIISKDEEQLSDIIMDILERGVTGLNGKGMYTKTDKQVLLCVVSKKEIAKLKEIVRKHDKNAFVIVADVREVLGEGFIEHHQ